jgi:hypothetical protein
MIVLNFEEVEAASHTIKATSTVKSVGSLASKSAFKVTFLPALSNVDSSLLETVSTKTSTLSE